MIGLDGQVVLVTGGGGGIGAAICRRLGREGCPVAVLDRDADGAGKTVAALRAAGGRANAYMADVSDHGTVTRIVGEIEAGFGAIAGLVNNAGWDRLTRFVDTEPDFWRKVIDINLCGFLNMHHAVLPRMAARGGGAIVNVASDVGRVGASMEAVYSACKGGMIAFSKTIAREHARDHIRVNTICPGPTDTPLLSAMAGSGDRGERLVESLRRAIPAGRLGQAEDYPGLVAFLLSEDAGFVTGQTISVSGGLTMHG